MQTLLTYLLIAVGALVGLTILTLLVQRLALLVRPRTPKGLVHAGEGALRRGRLQEAYDLFLKAEAHEPASVCAEGLGRFDIAARHAERAGQIDRAIALFGRAGFPLEVGRLYTQQRDYARAAQAFGETRGAHPEQVARLWENAFLDTVPSVGDAMTASELGASYRFARDAAEAYERAGDIPRAAHFAELSGDGARTLQLRALVPPGGLATLDYARDRVLERFSAAIKAGLGRGGKHAYTRLAEETANPKAAPAAPAAPAATTTQATGSATTRASDPSAPVVPIGPLETGQPIARSQATGETPALSASVSGAHAQRKSPRTIPNLAARLDRPSSLTELRRTVKLMAGPAEAMMFDVESPDMPPTDRMPRLPPGLLDDDRSPSRSDLDEIPPSFYVDELLLPDSRLGQRQVSANLGTPARADRPLAAVEPPDTSPTVKMSALPDDDLDPRDVPFDHEPVSRREHDSDARLSLLDTGTHEKLELFDVADPSTGVVTQVRRKSRRYHLLEELGQGRMSVVLRAHDVVLGRPVALKLLPPRAAEEPALFALFEREARTLAKLRHPNIITVHEFGVLDGRPFVAMDIIEGETLDTVLLRHKDDRLAVVDVLDVADGLLSALGYAHKRGIAHLDVNPGNVMRATDGRTLLMDFGFAPLIAPTLTSRPSGGTAYLAPEQMRGKTADHRADLFSAGVALYQLLTGQLPFESWSYAEAPRSTRTFSRAIPEMLDALILQCLDPEPANRPDTVEPLLKAVQSMRRQVQAYLNKDHGLTRSASFRAVSDAAARGQLSPEVKRLLRDYLESGSE